ncbi:MAG: PspC domain-containing protein [Saprospiraceae bacterium]|nr:PspC domain-containing protein [Saprospiraceae bacterium]
MNKVLQINVGGIPFTIDDDAYRKLSTYLDELETHFKYSDSSHEILSDIEARLAELLTERLKGRDIVNIADVLATIKIMGNPNEFDDAYIESEPRSGGRPWDVKTGKKLFRDPDNQVIGGVCSGLAAYFGIEDPIWVRLAFVIIFFTMGFGMLLYIIMWIMVPEAKTAGDRLAMMGEPANVQNIAKMIERGIDDLSETIKDNWNDLKSKKKR